MNRFNFILLVDDDEVSNFINRRILETLKITKHTHSVRNGRDALAYIAEHCKQSGGNGNCPDLILLDIQMPVMDGLEFLTEFFKKGADRSKRIKVVMLTSSSNPRDVEAAKKFNISGYVNKPLTAEKFYEALTG